MRVFFSSPRTQQQAEHLASRPVLLSFTTWAPWLSKGYVSSFDRLLLDSGAFSALNSGQIVDNSRYREWVEAFAPTPGGYVNAFASLDSIDGDYRKSIKHLDEFPGSFPTFHPGSDPPELVDDLIPYAEASHGKFMGIGVVPGRHGSRHGWHSEIADVLEKIPAHIHVHGWALRIYSYFPRIDSSDSTTWWQDAQAIRKQVPWLSFGEALDIAILRIERTGRHTAPKSDDEGQIDLL